MNRFEDMMEHLRNDTDIPEQVWTRYTETLSGLPDRKPDTSSHRGLRKHLWPAAAAAVLALGTVSAGAAIQWSHGLEKRLQVSSQQQQEMEADHMTAFVNQAVTQNDVTITARQSIVDNYTAYLSFEIEGFSLKEGQVPEFSQVDFFAGDGNFSCSAGFYCDETAGSENHSSYTLEDGTLEYHVIMRSNEKGYFIGNSIHVEFHDLGIYTGKTTAPAVQAEGTWSFDWTLAGCGSIKTYSLQASLGDSNATVLEAEISPISIALSYDFPYQEKMESSLDENGEETFYQTFQDPPMFAGVRMKDGTVCTGISSIASMGYAEDPGVYLYSTAFKPAIEVNQVESLLFYRNSPENESSCDERNLYVVPLEE